MVGGHKLYYPALVCRTCHWGRVVRNQLVCFPKLQSKTPRNQLNHILLKCFILIRNKQEITEALQGINAWYLKVKILTELAQFFCMSFRVALHHGPWSRIKEDGPTSWFDFLKKLFTKLLGPSSNVDQEEWPCIKKWIWWIFWYMPYKGNHEKINQVWPLSCLHLIFPHNFFFLIPTLHAMVPCFSY